MNSLTIDLESWIHMTPIEIIDSKIRKKMDNGFIIKATILILKLLKKYQIKTTFFVVGEIFEWYPSLIHEIYNRGHEIAFHTHKHTKLQTEDVLIKEIKASKALIEEFDPKGFRAPKAFIKRSYLKILHDNNFQYDSSTYGEFKSDLSISGINEMSISTFPLYNNRNSIKFPKNINFKLLSKEIPFGSGYFIGILGNITSWFIENLNEKGKSANLFIHPWQIYKPQRQANKFYLNFFHDPRIMLYWINRYNTFEYLLSKHEFTSLQRLLEKGAIDEKG